MNPDPSNYRRASLIIRRHQQGALEHPATTIPAHRWPAARRLVRVRRMMHRYIWPAIDYAARAAFAWFAFAGLFATLRGQVMPTEITIALLALLALSALLVRRAAD